MQQKRTWLSLLAALLIASLVMAACAARPTLEEELSETVEEPAADAGADAPSADAEPAADANEAPMLAEMVAAGDLPPLEERLPENPLVVEPVESIGEYGGTWRRVFKGINDFHTFGRVTYEPMLRWPRDPSDSIQAGIAESWEFNEDGTQLTLNLREGLKWSDGEPFTSADIVFWWEDIETNEEITPAPHDEWVVDGEPMTVEAPDEYTVVLTFAAPNGLAETTGLAFHGNQWPLGFERFGFFAPRHYLEQFHPDYNPDATYEMFDEMALDFNTERPALTPWTISEWSPGATEMVAARNPYYWKVDTEGNQLPYIDELHFTLVEDNEAANLLALAGDIDMQARHMDFAKFQVFQESAEQGDFTVGQWTNATSSDVTFFPNQSFSDPQYRELMQNADFRRALSLGIDRDLVNDIAFLGQATPFTQSVVRDSATYVDDVDASAYTYDIEAANALLDEIGLARGDDGFRTFEDGTVVNLIVETSETSGSSLDVVELAAESWREDLGLQTTVQAKSRDVFWPRAGANEVMIAVWGLGRGLTPMVDPIYQFPFDERAWMAPAFGTYYKTSGELGEEPSAEMQEMMDLYDQYKATADADEQLEIARELVRRGAENVYVIGTVGETPGLVVVKNNMRNVIADNFTADWIIMSPGTQDPSQYWLDQSE